jgi:hypothetical protein
MDPPDPGIFLHGQVPCVWLQRHGPVWGGAGAHLARSREVKLLWTHAWGGLEEQGLTSLDPGKWSCCGLACVGRPFIGTSPAHGCWIYHIRNFHDRYLTRRRDKWSCVGSEGRNREREQREGTRGFPRPRIGGILTYCAPPVLCRLPERERGEEIGRVRPGERIRAEDFSFFLLERGARLLCASLRGIFFIASH